MISRVWDNFDETIIKADCEENHHLLLSKLLKIASENMEFIDFFLVLVFWFKLGILVYDKSLGCATSISRRAPGSGFISLQRHVKDPLTAGYWKICPFVKMLKTYPVTVKINITLSSYIGPRTLNPFRRSFSWRFHFQNSQIFNLFRFLEKSTISKYGNLGLKM